jgi:DNA-binding NarL/FixJ family response regulator
MKRILVIEDEPEMRRNIVTLLRSQQQAKREFRPNFSSAEPRLKLGLTPRAGQALLWLAQGKTNSDIATILGITESTVKKHVPAIFEKLGVETRGAATLRALELLNTGASSTP